MQILAHRGVWIEPQERNSKEALHRALQQGWGLETDIRDFDGELVISHDIPLHCGYLLRDFLEDYIQIGSSSMLAFNIKADGLAGPLQALLNEFSVKRYFCFDMSVPDMLSYLQLGLIVACRISEYEVEGLLTDMADVIWVDGFSSHQVSLARLARWLDAGKAVCIVSPELHQQPFEPVWKILHSLSTRKIHNKSLMLCTDYPKKAQEMFGEH
ncbi:hypothetical protein [Hafnia alvei]|uniref:Phosphodiesterase n=1 Tax=Hafnia alvei TaxID=569 RepID=A0ABD7QBD9_HAFAL|nr:hypothetical protein [Hafnia alvei]TBL69144.1 hypothetical protein EYY96_05390 [Hafnia alvei]